MINAKEEQVFSWVFFSSVSIIKGGPTVMPDVNYNKNYDYMEYEGAITGSR